MRRLSLSAALGAMLVIAMALPASADLTPQQASSFTRQLNINKALISLLPPGPLKSSLSYQWVATCNGLVSPPNNLKNYSCVLP